MSEEDLTEEARRKWKTHFPWREGGPSATDLEFYKGEIIRTKQTQVILRQHLEATTGKTERPQKIQEIIGRLFRRNRPLH